MLVRPSFLLARVALGADGIALLQQYVRPVGGELYRVFFLGRRVQCAVRVRAPADFNACVRSVAAEPWQPPEAVAEAVLRCAALTAADCGSVELLFDEEGRARYFDFNLLSTLPPAASGAYDELAAHVLRVAAAGAADGGVSTRRAAANANR